MGIGRRQSKQVSSSGNLVGTSRIEIQLRHEIGEFFETKHDKKSRVFLSESGGRYEVDIILPKEKIVIEYDSFRYHQGVEQIQSDLRKNMLLENNGYTVIRVRVRPLKLLGSDDVEVSSQEELQKITTIVLRRIEQVLERRNRELPIGLRRKIEEYSAEGLLLAASAADSKIDELCQASGLDQNSGANPFLQVGVKPLNAES